jgi:hypothetical protein
VDGLRANAAVAQVAALHRAVPLRLGPPQLDRAHCRLTYEDHIRSCAIALMLAAWPTTAAGRLMKLTAALAAITLVLSAAAASAQPLPLPKPPGPSGSCPHGYTSSGSSCVPSRGAQDDPDMRTVINPPDPGAKAAAAILNARQNAVDDIRTGRAAPYYFAPPEPLNDTCPFGWTSSTALKEK